MADPPRRPDTGRLIEVHRPRAMQAIDVDLPLGGIILCKAFLGALALCAIAVPASAKATTLYTIVAEATDGKVLLEQGDCRTCVTPASTFKIPLAVIGFDSGFLKDEHSPVLPYKEGYVD